jgi:hypothetical protein
LGCSSNDSDAGVGIVVQVPACSAFGFALVFDVLQLPSRHLSASGESDDIIARRYYEQKRE